jgi:hypothetical protein
MRLHHRYFNYDASVDNVTTFPPDGIVNAEFHIRTDTNEILFLNFSTLQRMRTASYAPALPWV